MQITPSIALDVYLNLSKDCNHLSGDIQYAVSCFNAALRDARAATGRNLDTGVKIPEQTHGNWLGCLGYMALLDQLGSAVKPSGQQAEGSSISTTLSYFSDCSEQDREAIYALRCAFAHDFSLFNPSGREIRRHRFFLTESTNGSVVTLPTEPWDQAYDILKPDQVTTIDLEAFGDLVESIVQNVIEHHLREELEIALEGGAIEMVNRYVLFIRRGSASGSAA